MLCQCMSCSRDRRKENFSARRAKGNVVAAQREEYVKMIVAVEWGVSSTGLPGEAAASMTRSSLKEKSKSICV